MSHAIFGYPHGDPLNSYYERQAREERYQAGREQRQRVGEAETDESRSKGMSLVLPTEDELHQSFGEHALYLPTVEELEREAERIARVGEFHGWLNEKAKELGLDRR